jgi:hypothetical protein
MPPRIIKQMPSLPNVVDSVKTIFVPFKSLMPDFARSPPKYLKYWSGRILMFGGEETPPSECKVCGLRDLACVQAVIMRMKSAWLELRSWSSLSTSKSTEHSAVDGR